MAGRRLLVVDDEPAIAGYVGAVAESLGYAVTETSDAETFLAAWRRDDPDVIVVDLVMPGVDGLQLVRRLAREKCGARVLIISGYADPHFEEARALGEAAGLGSITAMKKPLELAELERFLAATP